MAEPRSRRGHGEDSMYFDQANNYWVAAVSLGHKGGKRVRRKVFGRTKTEVKVKLRELRRDMENGVRSSATYTVSAALDDWLANGLSGRSDRTKELYRDTVKPLRERLGDVKLRELTAGASRRPWMRWPGGCPRAACRSPVCALSGLSGMPKSGIWSAGTWPHWSRPLPDGQAARPRA